MAKRDRGDASDALSVQEMQGWLREEVRDSAKAHELRTKEATQFVEEYATGKLTGEQAMERLVAYDTRWGDVLPDATAAPGVSDEEILRAIDRARESERKLLTSRSGRQRTGVPDR
jgi:hypothetical protein